MRLIDADTLIEDLEYDVELDARALDNTGLLFGRHRELIQFDKDCKQNAVSILKKTPTVDAEPVRHARWTEHKDYPGIAWLCSECGYFTTMRTYYCPNCGAKMDAERKEE